MEGQAARAQHDLDKLEKLEAALGWLISRCTAAAAAAVLTEEDTLQDVGVLDEMIDEGNVLGARHTVLIDARIGIYVERKSA